MGISISSSARCSLCTSLLPKNTLCPWSARCTDLHLHLSPPSRLRTTSRPLQTASSINTPNSAYTKPDSLGQIPGPSDSYCYLTGLSFSAFPYTLPFVLDMLGLSLVLPCLCAFTFAVSLMHLLTLFWLSELDSLCKSLITLFGHSFLEP